MLSNAVLAVLLAGLVLWWELVRLLWSSLRVRLLWLPGLLLLSLLLVPEPGLEPVPHRQPDSQLAILLQESIIIFCSLIYLLENSKIKSPVTMLALYIITPPP